MDKRRLSWLILAFLILEESKYDSFWSYTFSFWSIFSSIGVLIFVALILIILARDQ